MRYILLTLFFMVLALDGVAQENDKQLAQHYFSSEEFDKARIYYERLYDEDHSKFYFNRLLLCMQEVGSDKEIEKLLKRQVSYNRGNQEYQIQLAKHYETIGNLTKANKIYENLISKLQPRSGDITALFNTFKSQGKSDLAFQALQKGRRLLGNSYPLNFQFAEYYGSLGNTGKMMDEYLDLMDYHSSYQTSLKRILSNQIDFTIEDSEEYEILKAALILRIQKDPNNIGYAEMLTWLFIQRQNFMAAFVHVKAIDKRTKSEGSMVYKFGLVCVENKDYTAARKSFEYIVDLGERSELYLRAYNSLLNVRFLEVTTQRNFTQEELRETLDQFDAALDKFGRRRTTFSLMMERAHILAFYANKGIEAIEQLEVLIVIP